jgi:uncharacterized protein with beta-barrel porin domain
MVTGASPAQDMVELRLGVSLIGSDSMIVSLRYDAQTAAHYSSQALSLRLRKQH